MREGYFTIRKIVISGVLAAIVIVLGATRIGFIAVPTFIGNATIMHIPVIIGGILEGPVVGVILGFLFGVFSLIQATDPYFKNPILAIVPRLFIGVTAYLAYLGVRELTRFLGRLIANMSRRQPAEGTPSRGSAVLAFAFSEVPAVIVGAVVGSLTNTVLVLGMGVVLRYWTVAPALAVGSTQGVTEAILAAIVTVAVVAAVKGIEVGVQRARM